jgi:hypothetical protein
MEISHAFGVIAPSGRCRNERTQTKNPKLIQITNLKTILCSALAAGLLAALLATPVIAKDKLETKARVSKADAMKTALAKVPGGKVKEGELEEEKGRLIWSFDIAAKGRKDITEIAVDAITGEIVTVEKETPAQQAAEKAADVWSETFACADEAFTNVGRNAYFILEPGYELVFAGKEDGKQTELIITVLDETLDLGGVRTRIVEERETAYGKLVEVSRNFFAVGVLTKNVYYFGEDVDLFKAGGQVTHEGSWREGRDGAKHGIALPGTVKVGERYFQERAPEIAMDRAEIVSTSETVKTPAGVFKNCLKTRETTPVEPGTEYKLYAPGIGLVQDGKLKLVKHGFVKK